MERARLVRTAMKLNAQPGQSGPNGQSVQRVVAEGPEGGDETAFSDLD